jgi:hypothetical protein
MQVTSLSQCLAGAVIAAFALPCAAQVMQAPGSMPGRRFPAPPTAQREGVAEPPAAMTPKSPAGSPQVTTGATTTPNPTAAPNLPPSLLDKPARAARVTLSDGSLAVDANNSSLSEILKDLETSSGMTVDGFGKDSRIFGIYGPGSPGDVLSELLDGAGYNFLMVGATAAGTPREILLTARSNAPVSAPQPGTNSEQEEDEEPPANSYPPEQVAPPPMPPVPPSAEQRPRTPQEMLQELQRLRQQQNQQQPAPQ